VAVSLRRGKSLLSIAGYQKPNNIPESTAVSDDERS
jgi:hypothetical protein